MDYQVLLNYLPRFWEALLLTVRVGWQGVFLSLAVGILCAVIIQLKVPVLRQLVGCYVEVFRNTPLLVQLFFLYFALPKVGIKLTPCLLRHLGAGTFGRCLYVRNPPQRS